MHDFLKAWSDFKVTKGPRIFPGDELLLDKPEVTVLYDSWDTVISQEDFGAKQNCGSNDTRLHLSLLPEPFFGSIATAPVVILSLNPGLHYDGYYSEFFVPDYGRALLDTLRRRPDKRFPHMWLNPRFAWHSGFSYWHGRLAGLIDQFAQELKVRRLESLSFFAKSVATLQLVPYHSASFGLNDSIINDLESVGLARAFLRDILMPREDVLLVSVRKRERWNLPNLDSRVIEGSRSRAAYFTDTARKQIFKHLKKRYVGWRQREA